MPLAFALLTVAGILIYSGLKGLSIMDVLSGETGDPLDPKGGTVPTGGGGAPGADAAQGGVSASGSPKDIIDRLVIPISNRAGVKTSSGAITAANVRHGPTVSGSRSDHQGPPNQAWAADLSNGQSPTPEMDRLADDLAAAFGISWSGQGLVSKQDGPYRYQLIYRCGGPCNPGTSCGGNHCNHVHFGVKLTGPPRSGRPTRGTTGQTPSTNPRQNRPG